MYFEKFRVILVLANHFTITKSPVSSIEFAASRAVNFQMRIKTDDFTTVKKSVYQ